MILRSQGLICELTFMERNFRKKTFTPIRNPWYNKTISRIRRALEIRVRNLIRDSIVAVVIAFAKGAPLKFSLKLLFAIVAIAAVVIYNVPIVTEADCDFRFLGTAPQQRCGCSRGERWARLTEPRIGDSIDLQGRNKNQTFITILRNRKITAVVPTDKPTTGPFRITFRASLRESQILDNN